MVYYRKTAGVLISFYFLFSEDEGKAAADILLLITQTYTIRHYKPFWHQFHTFCVLKRTDSSGHLAITSKWFCTITYTKHWGSDNAIRPNKSFTPEFLLPCSSRSLKAGNMGPAEISQPWPLFAFLYDRIRLMVSFCSYLSAWVDVKCFYIFHSKYYLFIDSFLRAYQDLCHSI